jgi:hypothetical protein
MNYQKSSVVSILTKPKLVRMSNNPIVDLEYDYWSMENMELYKNAKINTKNLLNNLFDYICKDIKMKDAKNYPEPLEIL